MSIPIVTEGSITATVNNDSQSIHFTLRQQTNIAPCFSQFFPACCEILITIQVYREKTIQILEQLPPLILNLDTTYNQSVFEVFQRTINISHCNWKGGGGPLSQSHHVKKTFMKELNLQMTLSFQT